MRKKLEILFITFFLFSFLFSNSIEATVSSDFTNHQAPTDIFYPQEFNKLIMDLTIPSGSGGEDKLLTIVLQNEGSARDFNEFDKIKLWSEDGPEGFQGMEIDKEIGTFAFYNGNTSWYLDGLSESVPTAGLRIFISCEIGNSPTAYRSIQMKIPVFSDENENGAFEQGDLQAMSYQDCVGLTRIQQERMDAQEAARMYPLSPWDGPTPYYLDCPLDAIEDVARGLAEGRIVFLLQRHIIQVGERE